MVVRVLSIATVLLELTVRTVDRVKSPRTSKAPAATTHATIHMTAGVMMEEMARTTPCVRWALIVLIVDRVM